MDMDTDGFTDLVNQAEQLTAEMDAGADLPRVKRNLPQILEAGQRLWARNAQLADNSADVKASILLGAKGYNVPKISQTLESLSSMKTFEPLEPLHDTDITGFLKNERENALLAVIEQTRTRTMESIEKRHWESLELEWEKNKQATLNALISSNNEFMPFVQEATVLEDTVNMPGRSSLDNVETAYAKEVYEHNEEVIRATLPVSLIERFQKVAKQLDNKNVIELWSQVKYMSEIPTTSQQTDTRLTTKTNQAFVSQAIAYLEHSYKQYMSSTVYENLQRAHLGGVPGTVQLVRSFLNVRQLQSLALEDGVVEGQPIWAMIYYCLRCGDLQAANSVVSKVAHKIGEFPAFLQEYVNSSERRLSTANETKIRLHYRRIIRNSRDPYKRAVYCIIGQCDSSDDHSEIADKIDDYLWIKLKHTHVVDKKDSSSTDQFSLSQLQHLLYTEFGETHFSAYQQPFLYVQVLLLTAQFEAAIEFLSRIDKLRCHAVHIALALHQLKLLNVTGSLQTQLLFKDSRSEAPLYKINLARLILLYTRKFESTDSRDALQYFYFLRDMETDKGDNLFMSCVSELVQETREFDMLLGHLTLDGTYRPGAIEKFKGDTNKIIEIVAKDTEAKGCFEDSVKLYNLAKKPNKVLELLNKLLGQVVSQSTSNQSNRERLRTLAVSIAERYRAATTVLNQSVSSTFYLLLDLLTFFDLYHSASYDHALEVVRQLKLLPVSKDAVGKKVEDFRNYTDEVRRSLPDIMLATMNCLIHMYKNIRSSSPTVDTLSSVSSTDAGKETYCNYLRSQARALVQFSGALPYRMPGDTNARLVQMEVLMH